MTDDEITRLRAENERLRTDNETLNAVCKRFQYDIARLNARVKELEGALEEIKEASSQAGYDAGMPGIYEVAIRALRGETK